jgi:hypothetical protein
MGGFADSAAFVPKLGLKHNVVKMKGIITKRRLRKKCSAIASLRRLKRLPSLLKAT